MPVDFDVIYDEATVARLDRFDRQPRPRRAVAPPPPGWRRTAVTGGLLTGLAFGFRDLLDPRPETEVVEEIDVDAPPCDDRPVRFVMVDGVPPASRIILRPWLAST